MDREDAEVVNNQKDTYKELYYTALEQLEENKAIAIETIKEVEVLEALHIKCMDELTYIAMTKEHLQTIIEEVALLTTEEVVKQVVAN